MIDRSKLQLFGREKRDMVVRAAQALVDQSEITRTLSMYFNTAAVGDDQEALTQARAEHQQLSEILERHHKQLKQALDYATANQLPAAMFVLENRIGEIEQLQYAIENQDRELKLMAGEPIEPKVHFASATLVGRFGMGM